MDREKESGLRCQIHHSLVHHPLQEYHNGSQNAPNNKSLGCLQSTPHLTFQQPLLPLGTCFSLFSASSSSLWVSRFFGFFAVLAHLFLQLHHGTWGLSDFILSSSSSQPDVYTLESLAPVKSKDQEQQFLPSGPALPLSADISKPSTKHIFVHF